MESSQFEEINRRINSLQEAHIQDQAAMQKAIQELTLAIKPMSETYNAAVIGGKWVVYFVTFLSVAFGVILEIKKLFKK